MNTLISLVFQRKKKPKDKSVSAALLNEGIVGVIKLATPLSQEKQKRKEKEKHGKKTEEEEEKKEGKDEKEEEEKEEKPSTTVRRRNKRHLKVTIAPGTVTPASAEQVRMAMANLNVSTCHIEIGFKIHKLKTNPF